MNAFIEPDRGALFRVAFLASLVVLMVLAASCQESGWTIITAGEHPHTPAFLAVKFSDKEHGWAVTPTAVFETNDGGRTWSPRIEDITGERTFFAIEFVDRSTGFVVGAQRKETKRSVLILRTNDAGKSWTASPTVSPAAPPHQTALLHAVSFCGPQFGWAVGSNLILRTIDGGNTWHLQNGNTERSLLSVTCTNQEQAWAVGEAGLILNTNDGGQSWNRQESKTTANLARVRFFGNIGWIVGGVGGRSVLLKTRDSGASWEHQKINLSEALFDIHMSGKQGWIVGATGTILGTNDGGQTWTRQQSPTTNDLTCLFFLSPHEGWAGGNKRTLLQFSQ